MLQEDGCEAVGQNVRQCYAAVGPQVNDMTLSCPVCRVCVGDAVTGRRDWRPRLDRGRWCD